MFNTFYRPDPSTNNLLEGLYASLLSSGPLAVDATTEAFVQVPWASVVAIVTPIVVGGVWVIKRTIERGEKDRELLSAQIEKEHTALTSLLKTLQTYVENATEHKEKVAQELASVSNKQDEQVKRLDAHVASLVSTQEDVMSRLSNIDEDLKKLNELKANPRRRAPVRRKKVSTRR